MTSSLGFLILSAVLPSWKTPAKVFRAHNNGSNQHEIKTNLRRIKQQKKRTRLKPQKQFFSISRLELYNFMVVGILYEERTAFVCQYV